MLERIGGLYLRPLLLFHPHYLVLVIVLVLVLLHPLHSPHKLRPLVASFVLVLVHPLLLILVHVLDLVHVLVLVIFLVLLNLSQSLSPPPKPSKGLVSHL